MSNHVAAIVQARIDSTRLPGKVLKPIGNYTMLEHVYHRVKTAVPNTIIAIPGNARNTPLAEFCLTHGLNVWAHDGKEDDVLARYAGVAKVLHAPWIIRVTADCPLMNSQALRDIVDTISEQSTANLLTKHPVYFSSAWPKRQVPVGLDFDVFTWEMLRRADASATGTAEREHVSPWMRKLMQNRKDFAAYRKTPAPEVYPGTSDWRLVVDTPEDLAWFQMLEARMGWTPPFPIFKDVYAFLSKHPELIRHERPVSGPT